MRALASSALGGTVLLFVFCCASATSGHPAEDSNRGSNNGASALKPLCGSGEERALRQKFPELVPCGNRRAAFVRLEVNRHALVVVGYDQDPCCADVDAPQYRAGSTVFLDGKTYRGGPFWTALGSLERLDAATARALLQAVLLWRGVTSQAITPAERASFSGRWPSARVSIEKAPAGFTAVPEGHRLVALHELDESVMGRPCRRLSMHQARLTAQGRVELTEPQRLADAPAGCTES